jgi:hypothetical protein
VEEAERNLEQLMALRKRRRPLQQGVRPPRANACWATSRRRSRTSDCCRPSTRSGKHAGRPHPPACTVRRPDRVGPAARQRRRPRARLRPGEGDRPARAPEARACVSGARRQPATSGVTGRFEGNDDWRRWSTPGPLLYFPQRRRSTQGAEMRAALMSNEEAFVTYPEGMTLASQNAQLGDPGACRRR